MAVASVSTLKLPCGALFPDFPFYFSLTDSVLPNRGLLMRTASKFIPKKLKVGSIELVNVFFQEKH